MGKTPRLPLASDERISTPFAGLAGMMKDVPPGPASKDARPDAPALPARAVVRYERKGHGGKAMTRVEQLGLAPAALAQWLRDLKETLGCGGSVDGEDLLLQGDQRDRLRECLEGRGVARVVVS